MSITTALILVGRSHPNHSGIIPTHLIRLTENSRPALILQSLDEPNIKPLVLIPSVDQIIDDIYLMISTYILKLVQPSKELCSQERISIYELFDTSERQKLYTSSRQRLKGKEMKVVFNILEDSLLLGQIPRIQEYPMDFEITTTVLMQEYNCWSNKVEPKTFE
jgi:hypothetical protein